MSYWIVSAHGERFALEVRPGDAEACINRIHSSDFRVTKNHTALEVHSLPEITSTEWLKPIETVERTPS